jgi:hypothetical protein
MGYGNLAQKLEQLAQTLGAPASATGTATTPATATTATGSAVSTTSAPTPAVATSTATATTAPATSTTPAASTAPATHTTANRLLAAFTKLFSALQPKSTTPAADAPATDMVARLKQFLTTLAQNLQPGAGAVATSVPSASGSLLDVTA